MTANDRSMLYTGLLGFVVFGSIFIYNMMNMDALSNYTNYGFASVVMFVVSMLLLISIGVLMYGSGKILTK